MNECSCNPAALAEPAVGFPCFPACFSGFSGSLVLGCAAVVVKFVILWVFYLGLVLLGSKCLHLFVCLFFFWVLEGANEN